MKDEQDPLLFLAPLILLDGGVQMIVPSFAALLSDTTFQRTGNMSPLLWSLILHEHQDFLVLFFGPGTLDETGV
jgi:hypothetical protein